MNKKIERFLLATFSLAMTLFYFVAMGYAFFKVE